MIWWVLGCVGPPPSGTAVGNPGDLDDAARSLDPAVVLAAVTVSPDLLVLRECGGGAVSMEAGNALPVEVPGGRWCGIELLLAAPIEVTGMTTAGTVFTVTLPVDYLAVAGPVVVDGERFLVDLPLPLDAETLDALGPDVVLPPDDLLAEAWAEDVLRDVALYEDVDEDGLVTAPDLQVAVSTLALDTALAALADGGDAGCGCATGAPAFGWWVLPMAGFALRRRRAAAVR